MKKGEQAHGLFMKVVVSAWWRAKVVVFRPTGRVGERRDVRIR